LANNPFESRTSEDIAVHVDGDRALVTLIVVGTRRDDKSVHRYRNVHFFTQEGNRWLLDAWYNYEVTGL
jgi:ketosteroid isomerase-like protein